MGNTARKMHETTASHKSARPELHLVDNRPTKAKVIKAQARQSAVYNRIFLAITMVVISLAVVSTGSVWMVAESTRLSKIASVKQQLVYDELGQTQELTVKLAASQSAARIEKIARTDLGMVASTGDVTYVTLTPSVANKPAQVQRPKHQSALLTTLAELTVGEASTLLVGDLGISALR